MSIRVIFADDTEIIRRAIRNLLDGEPKIKIVGNQQRDAVENRSARIEEYLVK